MNRPMNRPMNHEDAAIHMEKFAAEIIQLARRMDAFVKLLRPEWQEKFNAVEELHSIDSPAADALKQLADAIFLDGQRAEETIQ